MSYQRQLHTPGGYYPPPEEPYYGGQRTMQQFATRTIYPGPAYTRSPVPYQPQPQYSNGYPPSPSTSYKSSRSSYSGSYQAPTQTPEYCCLFVGCIYAAARKADLERHVQVTHNRLALQLIPCEHLGCHRTGQYGFTRRDKMVDHMRDVHKAVIPKRQNVGRRQSGDTR